jgi:hypothetical protein
VIEQDSTEILRQLLDEQRKTNNLLIALIDSLADSELEIDGIQPTTYLSGKPVSG